MNCVVQDNVRIGKRCEIGNNVVIHCGTVIGDEVYVGDNAVLGRKPRSGPTSIRKTDEQAPLVIGDRVVIGTSAVIYAGTKIKDDAMVADLAAVREGCLIGEGARIGRCVTVECNTMVGKGSVVQTGTHLTGDMIVEDQVFIGPEVCTANDKYMSRRLDVILKGPVIRKGASVGANATLLPGVEIGPEAVVGAGAVVIKDVPAGEVVVGNPAVALRRSNDIKDHPEG
ncbi:MAG: N-acetyltransferase [Actinobacteria bacterium]|nr:N-acetyltransferase [Actinomycetota bacterium]